MGVPVAHSFPFGERISSSFLAAVLAGAAAHTKAARFKWRHPLRKRIESSARSSYALPCTSVLVLCAVWLECGAEAGLLELGMCR